MKRITFFGSGTEIESIEGAIPDFENVVDVIKDYYHTLVYGGTNIGYMNFFAEQCRTQGMEIESVIPVWFAEKYPNIVCNKSDTQILVDSLSKRKLRLMETDAIICYPGGVGTFDEMFDVLARISLGELKQTPMFIYNFERFYSPLLLQMEYGIKTKYIKEAALESVYTFEHSNQLRSVLKNLNDK